MEKKHLGTVAILIKDRHAQAPNVNQILTNHGQIVLARLGLNMQPKCIDHCTGMITLVVQGTSKEISALTKELDQIYGIVAKSSIVTD